MPDNQPLTTAPDIKSLSNVNNQPVASSQDIRPKSPKKFSFIAALIAAIIVLGAGSAAAYYGVIVPNKPENVLKQAIANTISQKKLKFDGKLSYESTDEGATIKAVNVAFNGSADIDTNALSSAFEVTASGIKLPFELRHIDKNIYLKIGDLSSLQGLVQTVSPAYAPTFAAFNKKLANQWVEIDETLLKQANADCSLNTGFTLSKTDMDLLEKRFKQVPFTSVKTTSNDTVNGRAAIKYEVEINSSKGAEYFKGLQDLSVVKKLKECNSGKNTKLPKATPSSSNEPIPLTIWVDKDNKQIVKLAGKTTPKDEAQSKAKGSFEVTMQYGQASIVKPDGAKPLLTILGDFSSLFNVNNSSTQPAQPSSSSGGASQACLQAIQDYTSSGGSKPIPSCM